MPIPAIIAVLGKVLGGLSTAKGLSKTDEQENRLNFNRRQYNQSVPTVGDTVSSQQPQSSGGWNKFQNGASKAMTIASILGSLKGNDQQQQPYTMQFNRRR